MVSIENVDFEEEKNGYTATFERDRIFVWLTVRLADDKSRIDWSQPVNICVETHNHDEFCWGHETTIETLDDWHEFLEDHLVDIMKLNWAPLFE